MSHVITEDDDFEFLMEWQSSNLLFLGFRLNDWNFQPADCSDHC